MDGCTPDGLVQVWEEKLRTQLDGFDRFVFIKGMEFGATCSWWDHEGKIVRSASERGSPHNGVDFALWTGADGTDQPIPIGVEVHSVAAGEVLAVFQDFIATTVVVEHPTVEGPHSSTFCSVYGHITPADWVEKGALVTSGRLVGTVAANRKTSCPHHLHLSTGWLKRPIVEPNSWLTLCRTLDFFSPPLLETMSMTSVCAQDDRAGHTERIQAESREVEPHSSDTWALPDVPLQVLMSHLKGPNFKSGRLVSTRWRNAADVSRRQLVFHPKVRAGDMASMVNRCPLVTVIKVAGNCNAPQLLEILCSKRSLIRRLHLLDISYTAVGPNIITTVKKINPHMELTYTGTWRATHTNPRNTPLQVLEAQLWAIRERGWHKDGMEAAFHHASPSNQAYTGPAGVFGTMIRLGYNDLLRWSWYSVISEQSAPDCVNFKVILGLDVEQPHSGYRWHLSLQKDDPYAGCWMTDGVESLDVSSVAEVDDSIATKRFYTLG